jgi:hypothetical protein
MNTSHYMPHRALVFLICFCCIDTASSTCVEGSYGAVGETCASCPQNSSSLAGSTTLGDCTCVPGFSGQDAGACSKCAIGKYRATNFATNWARACGAQRNTACVAFQSSTSNYGVADRGVDGMLSTNYDDKTCTHTYPNNPPWWALDLGLTPIRVTGLRALGRNTIPERSDNFTIYIGNDTSIEGRFVNNVVCVTRQGSLPTNGDWKDITCNHPISGRYVYIMIPIRMTLTLCEVEVWSSDCALCPANSESRIGSDIVKDCQCLPGYTGVDGGTCSQCAAGKYKNHTGQVESINSCTLSGTMYGNAIGPELEATAYIQEATHNFIIFIVYSGGHYKMARVKFADALTSTTPDSLSDKYITSPPNIVLDATTVSCMWNNTLAGHKTMNVGGDDRYEMKEVRVDCCNVCPPNSISAPGSTGCTCLPGYSGGNGNPCTLCTPGTYSTGSMNLSTCTDCPAGTYGLATGGKSLDTCLQCSRGKYSELVGSNSIETCLTCPAGKFHRKLGASSPDQCAVCTCR